MENKEEFILMRIELSRRKKWENYFKSLGLNLSSGIRASVEKFIRDSNSGITLENNNVSEKIDQLSTLITNLEKILIEKERKILDLDYDIPQDMEIENYDEISQVIFKKLATYGCLGIIPLSQLVKIEGSRLLIILKRMKNEPNPKIKTNNKYEWCLK